MKSMFLCTFLLLSPYVEAQVTKADYERATSRRSQLQGLAINMADPANAIPDTNRFWYRKTVKGGSEFVVVDPDTQAKRPAFDQEKLAAALSTSTGEKYQALTLPFSTFTFTDKQTG